MIRGMSFSENYLCLLIFVNFLWGRSFSACELFPILANEQRGLLLEKKKRCLNASTKR